MDKVDESATMSILPIAANIPHSVVIMQPYFFLMQVYGRKVIGKLGALNRVIGVDVADTDSISSDAAQIANYASALIVPSNFSRSAYISSGVKAPVHVVPHGVDDFWFTTHVSFNFFRGLLDFKAKRGVKLIQTWLLHSSFRKGEDIVYNVFSKLIKERRDVALVVKRPMAVDVIVDEVKNGSPKPIVSIPASWLSEEQIRELMDVCDIFLLASRGGGFEHPPLLALARGEVVLGAKGGAWEEYLPDWALAPSHRSDIIFKDNPIHNGRGVEMEIDTCVSMLHSILDNIEEYKVRVKQHVDTYVKQRFTWSKIGELLRDIVSLVG